MPQAKKAPVQEKTPKKRKRVAKGRDKLILVAMQLFGERGFDGVTVRDIAAEADVALGLISHHFKNKEGLRDAVDDYFLSRTSAAITNANNQARSGDLESFIETQRGWIQEYEDEWPSFVSYFRRAITDGGDWGQNLVRQYYDFISRIFDHLETKGQIPAGMDKTWLTLIFMFILVGPLVLSPHIESILGESPYTPEMWAGFQKNVSLLMSNGKK